jgi:hypothetical protein
MLPNPRELRQLIAAAVTNLSPRNAYPATRPYSTLQYPQRYATGHTLLYYSGLPSVIQGTPL